MGSSVIRGGRNSKGKESSKYTHAHTTEKENEKKSSSQMIFILLALFLIQLLGHKVFKFYG